MKLLKILIVFMLSMCVGVFLASCKEARIEYAAKQFKNIDQIVLATKDSNAPLNKDAALTVIGEVAKVAAAKLDPEGEVEPTSTASAIAARPQEELQKIIQSANAGPSSGWFNWATILGGAAIVAGIAGRFLGPPFNIAGNAIQLVASRFVPNYDKTKVAAAGLIASTDKMLTDYGELLETMPEVKAKLKEKLNGKEPVDWMKDVLRRSQTDLGTHSEIAEVIKLMKKELPTSDGKIAATMKDLDEFIAKKI
jgi:hypothetical protein